MLNSILARKHRWIVHVLSHDELLCNLMEWLENLQEAGEGYSC